MAFFGINTVWMAERTQLAGLKEIERLDLFGIRFSSIERFEALHQGRTAIGFAFAFRNKAFHLGSDPPSRANGNISSRRQRRWLR
jgi:hypothetical protein